MATFTVYVTTPELGRVHAVSVPTAGEAIRAAGALYVALHAVLGGGAPESGIPSVFEEIKRRACTRVGAEPRNRAFVVRIEKAG